MKQPNLQQSLAEIVRLTQEKKRIENRLTELRAGLLNDCRRRDLSGVVGPTHEFRVTRRPALILPKRSEPERILLEQDLKTLGYWQRVSSLNRSALRRLLDLGLPANHRQQILRHVGHLVRYQAALYQLDRDERSRQVAA